MPRLRPLLFLLMLSCWPSLGQASFGHWLQETAFGAEGFLAGLDSRDLQVDDHRWHLYTRHLDSGAPCVVMVHGFTARGAHWFRMARQLPRDRCLIVVDLPGFGASTYLDSARYDLDSQADRLAALLSRLALRNPRVDLIGNSMGGAVSAHFALRHPEQVRSLALIDAAGVSSPVKSALGRQIDAGRNPFFAQTPAEFRRFYTMTMSQPPFVPDVVKDAGAEEAIARTARYRRIFSQIYGVHIDDRLGEIRAPTLIVWGDRDQLLDVSMVKVWSRIAGSRAVILPGIGHMPQLECPGELAARYADFLSGLH